MVSLDVYDDIERCMAGSWSDGLPVIPPYGSLVDDMLAAMGWDYTEVVGSLPEQSIEVHASHVAAAVMAGCRFEYGRPTALGIDLTLGCLGTLAALNVAHGWLTVAGGGYAAIVTAERWAYTVDRSATATMTLWAHSDGAGALVVGLGTGDSALAVYQGAEFVSAPEMNGRVLIKYGGTRYPTPHGARALPPGRSVPARATRSATMLTRLTGLPPSSVVVSGHSVGHIGPADVIVGFDRLCRAGQLDGPVAVASSTPYAFGFGLITPPAG